MPEPEFLPFEDESEQAVADPLYHIILFNDDEHSYDYVCEMLVRLFGMTSKEAWDIAYEVDYIGESVVATLPFEQAAAGRDAIRQYGPDPRLDMSTGSMHAAIQPVEDKPL